MCRKNTFKTSAAFTEGNYSTTPAKNNLEMIAYLHYKTWRLNDIAIAAYLERVFFVGFFCFFFTYSMLAHPRKLSQWRKLLVECIVNEERAKNMLCNSERLISWFTARKVLLCLVSMITNSIVQDWALKKQCYFLKAILFKEILNSTMFRIVFFIFKEHVYLSV